MEMRLLFIGVAALSALLAGYFFVGALSSIVRSRNVVLYARGTKPSIHALAALHLETGVAALLPLSDMMLRIRPFRVFAERMVGNIRACGMITTSSAFISLLLALSIVLLVLVGVLTGSVLAGGAVVVCALAFVVVWSSSQRDRQQNLMREEIPGVLELMAACFGLGFTLLQTFQQIADNVPGQLGLLFGEAAHILETGGSMHSALELLRSRTDISELAFVIAALEVQHQNGGAVTQLLESAAKSVKSELALKRSLQVQTAQAKLSARVVIVMPFILIALFSLITPGFLAPFFTSFAGFVLLAVALLMQMGGIVLVRRTLAIEGLS